MGLDALLKGADGYREFRSLFAVGKKLLRDLDVLHLRLGQRLPEGRTESRPWLGCVGSAVTFLAFDSCRFWAITLMGVRGVPMTPSAALTTL